MVMKDCFEEFLRRIPRFQDLASRLKPRKVTDPFLGNNGGLRREFQTIWYRLFAIFCIYIMFYSTTLLLAMLKWMQSLVELHSRPNLSILQYSVFIGGDLVLQRCSLYTQAMTSFANPSSLYKEQHCKTRLSPLVTPDEDIRLECHRLIYTLFFTSYKRL